METPFEDYKPRAYQIELFEKALEYNSIIYLPTGTGKTYIAIMLIKKLSGDLVRPYSAGGKRTIFAVNTVALAEQQSKYLTRHTHLTCGSYTGDMQMDYWTKEKWLAEMEKHQVLIMTSQIFLDILNHGYISLKQLNLMVFDECHRAVNDHPMRLIMQTFQDCPKNEQPRVLGLTATLLNGNVTLSKLEQTIQDLETTFHAKIVTVESLIGVKDYATNPAESCVLFSPHVNVPVLQKISAMIYETKKILKVVNINACFKNVNPSDPIFRPKSKLALLQNILTDLDEHLTLTGIYGGSKAAFMHTIQLESIKNSLDDQRCNVQQAIRIFDHLITVLTKIRKILEDEMKGYSERERIIKFSSDQVIKLIGILETFHKTKLPAQKFCTVVFVRRRFTAKVLYHVLRNLHEFDERFKFLLVEFMIGYSAHSLDDARGEVSQRRWNKKVLHKFKNGQANCIVATDVIEEGVDVPECTLVVRYDLPMDVRSYIQSKGRARHATSKYTILVPSDDDQFQERYRNYKLIENELEEYLVGKSQFRTDPLHQTIVEELYSSQLEPYSVMNVDGVLSTVTETSAISLVNRYCSTLGNSQLDSLTPIWKLIYTNFKHTSAKYQVSLRMPILSPVKQQILGQPMQNINDAKRSAALNCCKKLHQIGELTDNLLPVTDDLIPEDVNDLFPNWINEEKGTNQPGTEARKRQHNLFYPECLHSAFPQPNEYLYLHVLNSKPTYSIPQDNRRLVFYNLLSDRAGFAILSTKSMPKPSGFSIFMNVGELHVDVEPNYSKLKLCEEEIEKLKIFHSMMFTEILQSMIRSFMVYDKNKLDNNFLIVPVDHKWEINWEVVTKYQTIELIQPEKPIHVKALDYELALVRPSYRAASVYVVTQICEDKFAESRFPTPDFYSYADYCKDRHALHIEDATQPLLEVKAISTKINCIRLRGPHSGLSKMKRADLLEDFEEHLIPELCVRINFPSLYWLKATTLPSIVHKTAQFLIAEQLKLNIRTGTALGLPELSKKQKWNSLKVSEDNGVTEITEPFLELSLDDYTRNCATMT